MYAFMDTYMHILPALLIKLAPTLAGKYTPGKVSTGTPPAKESAVVL